MNILEKLAKSQDFRPTTTQEYVALQLARYLKDTSDIRWYVRSIEYFGQDRLFSALQAVQRVSTVERTHTFRSMFHH
jgi:hypothetical protein